MSTSSLPRTNYTNAGTDPQTQANAKQKVLLRAQQLSTGTATAGQLYTNVDRATLIPLVKRKSMALDAFDALQTGLKEAAQVDLLVEDDPTGTAAEGKFAFVGTVTEAKNIKLGVSSERNGIIDFAVAVGDDADAVTTKAAAAAALNTDMVATAAVGITTNELEITASNDGVDGNDIPLKVYNTVPGITITITAMATGSGSVATRDIAAVVGSNRYQAVVQPSSYPVTDITTGLLDTRWNVDNKILDGCGFICDADTEANLITTLSSINSGHLVYLGQKVENRDTYKGVADFETPIAMASMVAGLRTRRLTDGALLTDIIDSTAGVKDGRGGAALASLPMFNTLIPSLPVTPSDYGFSETEIVNLNAVGVSVLGSNDSQTAMVLGELYTTYLTNIAGDDDDTYKFLNYRDTYSGVREFFFNNAKADFRQHRLTDGDLIDGRKIANKQSIEDAHKEYYVKLSESDYVLTVAGDDAVEFFENNLTVTLNLRAGTVTVSMRVPIVVQLRQIDATITYTFSVNG
jgi:phage tail sheath gpL-like